MIGRAPLPYLRNLSADAIKFDSVFVKGRSDKPHDDTAMRSIISA